MADIVFVSSTQVFPFVLLCIVNATLKPNPIQALLDLSFLSFQSDQSQQTKRYSSPFKFNIIFIYMSMFDLVSPNFR
jgi:hypothetical protein